MSIEEINLRRAIDDMKLSIQQHWQKINMETDATKRAEMKREWRENLVPALRRLLEEAEKNNNA